MKHNTLRSYSCLAAPKLNFVKSPAPIEFFTAPLVIYNIRLSFSCGLHRSSPIYVYQHMVTVRNKTSILKYKHPNNNYTMNKLTIHRTTNYPFFIRKTEELQLVSKKKFAVLQVQDYSCTPVNILLNNDHPNQWKLYRQQCRPPPFPSL